LSECLSSDATIVTAILNKRANLASRHNLADLCNLNSIANALHTL